METIEFVIEILKLTRDGNDLDGRALRLLEMGANNELNERGKKAIEDFYFEILELKKSHEYSKQALRETYDKCMKLKK